MGIKKISQYYEAYDLLLTYPDFYIEMSRAEGGMLCGLIQEYRPHNIYEIGVAAGGSTCLLLKCLELLGLEETTLCSIDVEEKFYRNIKKKTGYLLSDNKDKFYNYGKQKFLLGKYAVECTEEITGEIDFLFLDTTHRIPGEILDFLLLLPYMADGAVVVLHDTNLHNLEIDHSGFATRVLYNTVAADKFYVDKPELFNIGGFQITDETKKQIRDVFGALLLPWQYEVDEKILQFYRAEYQKHYSGELIWLFDSAVRYVKQWFEFDKEKKEKWLEKIKGGQLSMNLSFQNVLEKARKADAVVIVGAGVRGKELFLQLELEGSVPVKAFFDNSDKWDGDYIKDIKITKPYKVEECSCIYVIAVDSGESRKSLKAQLCELGIEQKNIVLYCFHKDYDYYSSLDEKFYASEIQLMYYERLGKVMNWEKPATYNEIINWEKVNIKDVRRTQLADKYLAREWIKERIGEKYLTKLYGIWDNANDIDFDPLPRAFVLKLNNGSSRNIIVKDKTKIDKEDICRKLNEWKDCNFAYMSLELHYRDIVPKIICEEYLEGVAESIYDYNIYCFHGEPEYIWCIKGSHRPDCQASFYDKNWVMQPFSYGYPKDPVQAPKPEKLEEMLDLCRILSADFKHVRIDGYNLPDGRVLFSEITFSTWSGLCHWEPEEYDTVFGKLISEG